MGEELQTNNTEEFDSQNYFDEKLTEQRENFVSKTSYDKLASDYKKMVDAITSGQQLNQPVEKKEKKDLNELQKKFIQASYNGRNLDVWKAAVDLADETMAQKGYNPMCTNGRNCKPEDAEKMNEALGLVKKCIEDCEDSDEVFMSLIKARTDDDPTFLRTLASRNK